MKIALISGNEEKQGFLPLGILYLAGYIRKYIPDIDIKVFDFIPAIREIEEFSPDIVGIGGLTFHYPSIYEFCSRLRTSFDGLIIMGGVHISMEKKLPRFVDIGVVGEGEETLCHIIECLRAVRDIKAKTAVRKVLYQVSGIIFWDGDQLVDTGERSRIWDLDRIPFPARDLIDMNYYLQPNNIFGRRIGRGTTLLSSRGCAFSCDFCSTSKFWGKPRYHSAQYVVAEISELIKTYNIQLLYICDDNFSSNLPRLKQIADEIERQKITIEIGIMGRVDFFNPEIAEIYNRIGIKCLSLGLETGSQRLLPSLKHGLKLSIDTIREQVWEMHNRGFELSACFMIGNPTETEAEILETLNFVKSLPLAKVHFTIATPLPNTRWWSIAKEQGIVPANPEWYYWRAFNLKELHPERPVFKNTVSLEKLEKLYHTFLEEQKKIFYFDWQAYLNQ